MSKYEKLWKYLSENGKDCYELSYEEMKVILGFEIDHSLLKYKKEAVEYGYEVKKISIKNRKIFFEKKNI